MIQDEHNEHRYGRGRNITYHEGIHTLGERVYLHPSSLLSCDQYFCIFLGGLAVHKHEGNVYIVFFVQFLNAHVYR